MISCPTTETVSARIIAMILSVLMVSTLLPHLLFDFVDGFAYAPPARDVVFIPAPIDKPGCTYDVLVRYCTPEAAVVTVIAVITHHKVVIFWHLYGRKVKYLYRIPKSSCYSWIVMDTWMLTHVRVFDPKKSFYFDNVLFGVVCFDILVALMRMEVEVFIVYKEHIAAYRYAAFDIVDVRIERVAKYYDIAAFGPFTAHEMSIAVKIWKYRNFEPWNMWSGDTVSEFFDKKVITNKEGIFHTSAGNDESLCDEKDYE